jgi:hypothetical protein
VVLPHRKPVPVQKKQMITMVIRWQQIIKPYSKDVPPGAGFWCAPEKQIVAMPEES